MTIEMILAHVSIIPPLFILVQSAPETVACITVSIEYWFARAYPSKVLDHDMSGHAGTAPENTG